MVFSLLIKGLRFRPYVSKTTCRLFIENFPANKPDRLLDSILAKTYIDINYFLTEPQGHFLYKTHSLLSCHAILTINQRRLAFEFCLLNQNNMRGKFTRGNPQEFHYQISSHSETEQIRQVSSTSSIK